MAAKVTVRELVTKLTIGGNAGDKMAAFGLKVNGVKAALDIMVGVVKAASAATLGLVDNVTQAGDAIAKTSREIGISAKSFQRLSFAADRSGAPLQNLKKGLQNIERNLRDATIAAGKGQTNGFTGALAEVGLRLRDLKGLDAEQKLGLIGEALSQVADEGRRVALSQKLVGEEAGPKLASLLAEGTSGIKALGDEAERLGLVMSDDALSASESFQDSMTNMKSVLKGIKTTIGIALIPVVKKSIDFFRDWLLINRKFITSKFQDFVKALSEQFGNLLVSLDDVVDAFVDIANLSAGVLEFFRDLSEAVGGLENLIRLATAAWVTYRIAAIAATTGLALGPLTILAVGLLAVGAAFADIETNADRARKARDRFNAGLNESKPIDKERANRDAVSLAKVARGGEVPKGLFERLVSQNSRQTQISLDAARVFVKRNVRNRRGLARQVGGRLSGKSGLAVPATGSVADPGQLEALNALESQIISQRGEDERFRTEAAGEIDFLDEAFAFNARAEGASGGGSRFRPFKEPDKGKKEKDSLADLLAGAIKSGSLPESAALLASTQPPIIIPITNNNFTIAMEATSVFEGVSGEASADFTERAEGVFTEMLGSLMNDTMDQVSTQLAR